MIVALVSLTLGVSVIIVSEISQFNTELSNRAILVARTVGNYSATNIASGDTKAASDSLAALEHIPDIINAHLYDKSGKLFASFRADPPPPETSAVTNETLYFSHRDYLLVNAPVEYRGERWGYIQLAVSSKQLRARVIERLVILLLLGAGLAIIAYLLARWLQSFVAQPILALAKAAEQVTAQPNYSVRVSPINKDEIGVLNDAFNTMLAQIGRRQQERDRAQKALTESEARFSAMFNSIPDGIVFADMDRRIVLINPALLALFGYSNEELLGHTTQMLYADPHDYVEQGRRRYRDNPDIEAEPYEIRYRRKDGSIFWSETLATHVRQADGTLIGFLGIIRDITERKAAEQASRANREHYRNLVETSQAVPWQLDLPSWRFTYIGPQAVGLLGYPVEAWYEAGFWSDHLHPEDRDQAIHFCQTETRRGEDHEFEYRMITADGGVVWIRDSVNVVNSPGGPVALRGFMFDITERKRVALELKAREERLRSQQNAMLALSKEQASTREELPPLLQAATRIVATTLDVARVSIWLYRDERTRIECIDLYDQYRDTHSAGQELSAGDYPNYFRAIEENQVIVADDVCSAEETQEFADTYLKPLNIQSMLDAPIRRGGTAIGVLCHEHTGSIRHWAIDEQNFASSVADAVSLILELWEHKLTEEELLRHKDHLEEIVADRTEELRRSNKELESFSYSVSHDLRAPLRSIDGFALALAEDYGELLDQTAQDYLTRIRSGAQHMARLIDDMLQLSRVTRRELRRQRVDVSALAVSVISELRRLEPQREVDVRIQSGLTAMGDRGLLSILLENLLGNAWKYTARTEKPVIEFGLQEQHGEPVFFVKDNGAGFDMSYVDKLFGTFQRLHRREDFPGTGIGLATVRRVIDRHGGRVWAEGKVDQGACFYFRLP
jgi:PAS domain S-box-containing protein